MSQTTKILASCAALVVLGVLAFSTWRTYEGHHAQQQYTTDSTPYKALMSGNPLFVQAEQAKELSNFAQALQLYKQALVAATDPVQKAQIAFDIASMEDRLGYTRTAIKDYKQVAAGGGYTIARAYAIQSLAQMARATSSATVRHLIYADAPYDAMVVKGDTALTDRHLFEAAAAIYPLANSEIAIADWYAARLEESDYYKKPVLPKDTHDQYVAIVNQSLTAADANIAQTKDDPNLATALPFTVMSKAVVMRSLARINIVTPAQAETVFQQSQNLYSAMSNADDSLLRVQYARFLQELYGAQRLDDIKKLLSPLSTPAYNKSLAVTFLKVAETNGNGRKRDMARIAAIDPDFKQFLMTLGWVPADFDLTSPSTP